MTQNDQTCTQKPQERHKTDKKNPKGIQNYHKKAELRKFNLTQNDNEMNKN